MSRSFFSACHSPGSPHGERPPSVAGRSVRSPLRGWSRAGLPAALASALVAVVLSAEPARKRTCHLRGPRPPDTRSGSMPWPSPPMGGGWPTGEMMGPW